MTDLAKKPASTRGLFEPFAGASEDHPPRVAAAGMRGVSRTPRSASLGFPARVAVRVPSFARSFSEHGEGPWPTGPAPDDPRSSPGRALSP